MNLKGLHFIGSCCIIISECKVQKEYSVDFTAHWNTVICVNIELLKFLKYYR